MNKSKEDITIKSFGEEWIKFDQINLNDKYILYDFEKYFKIFPWYLINNESVGFDMGCGTGRWAACIAPKIKKLNCVEPSDAINIAKKRLINFNNIKFFNEKINDCSIPKESQDFGYILGVLHHLEDPTLGLKKCVELLKPGAPILVYFYYSFENRPLWFRTIWKISNIFRILISRMPSKIKNFVCDVIAFFIYFPLTKLSSLLSNLGFNLKNIPLYEYKDKPFYTLRTDCRDRFGTIIEHRKNKKQIVEMMRSCNLIDIKFSDDSPFWCATAIKKR